MKFLNLRLAAASVIAGYRGAGAEGSLENRRFSGVVWEVFGERI